MERQITQNVRDFSKIDKAQKYKKATGIRMQPTTEREVREIKNGINRERRNEAKSQGAKKREDDNRARGRSHLTSAEEDRA